MILRKFALWVTYCFLIGGILNAQLLDPAAELSLREQLLTNRDSLKFEKLIKRAEATKVSAQLLFEAKFLFAIDTDATDRIVSLADQLELRKKNFKLSQSEIFSNTEDWLAVTEFILAISAQKRGDRKSFEQHAKQVFWLSPSQAFLLSPYIEKYKVSNLIEHFTLPKASSVIGVKGIVTNLPPLLKTNKGIAIYFFSPWDPNSIASAKRVKSFHQACEKKGLFHIHFCIETSDEVNNDLRSYIKIVGENNTHLWVKSNKGDPLVSALRVNKTPLIVTLNDKGKITFHGTLSSFTAPK